MQNKVAEVEKMENGIEKEKEKEVKGLTTVY